MCGILGVVNFGNKRISALSKYMKQGCVVGTLRGTDSTGLFQMDSKYKYSLHKTPYSGELYANSKAFSEHNYFSDETGYTILHHRAATKGSVTQENAHPFIHESKENGANKLIIGVHNGTLQGYTFKEDGRTFDVDSDYLMYMMLKEGAAEALSTIPGDIACVWTERDAHLRLFANQGRPLHFGILKNENAMLIASEGEMLYWLARRNSLDLEALVEVSKNVIHTFKWGEDVRDFTTENTRVPKAAVSYGTTTPKFSLSNYGFSTNQQVTFYPEDLLKTDNPTVRGYIDNGKEFYPAVMLNASVTTINALNNPRAEATVPVLYARSRGVHGDTEIVVGTPRKISYPNSVFEKEDAPEEVAEAPPAVKGPRGYVSLETFVRLTDAGCVSCGAPITVDEGVEGTMQWVNGGADPLCSACVNTFTSEQENVR